MTIPATHNHSTPTFTQKIDKFLSVKENREKAGWAILATGLIVVIAASIFAWGVIPVLATAPLWAKKTVGIVGMVVGIICVHTGAALFGKKVIIHRY